MRKTLLEELSQVRISDNDETFKHFFKIWRNTLDKLKYIKVTKYIRGNNASFRNKTLSKDIIEKPNLRNKYLKSKSEEDWQSYAKQRNLCVSVKIDKKELLFDLVSSGKITLVENEKIITDDKKIVKNF